MSNSFSSARSAKSLVSRGFRGRRAADVDPARVPPGQYVTRDFPVLSAGPTPHTSLELWDFSIVGDLDEPNASAPPEAEMDELMLDGNAVAGLLQEVFAVEMTTAVGTCASCGAAGPVGAVHVYRGAGIVLRCPHCDNVLAKIVKSDSRVWIDSTGIRTLEVSL